MNFNVTNLTIFGAACVLLYSGITCRNPVEVIKYALQGKIAPTECGKASSSSSSSSKAKKTTNFPEENKTVTAPKEDFPEEHQTTTPIPLD
jgi:hypothetical protein